MSTRKATSAFPDTTHDFLTTVNGQCGFSMGCVWTFTETAARRGFLKTGKKRFVIRGSGVRIPQPAPLVSSHHAKLRLDIRLRRLCCDAMMRMEPIRMA